MNDTVVFISTQQIKPHIFTLWKASQIGPKQRRQEDIKSQTDHLWNENNEKNQIEEEHQLKDSKTYVNLKSCLLRPMGAARRDIPAP